MSPTRTERIHKGLSEANGWLGWSLPRQVFPRRLLDAGGGSGWRGGVTGGFGRAAGSRGCRGGFDFNFAMGVSVVSVSCRRSRTKQKAPAGAEA